jgi:serine/threonine protein kinase
MVSQHPISRDFLTVASDLAMIDSGSIADLSGEAADLGIAESELMIRKGLLSHVQVDVVETLRRPLETIPGYEILGVLGYGGMGVVYQARQINLDRPVALKTVQTGQTNYQRAKARFEQEAQALGRLVHPNIVAAYDFGEHDGRLYFAMEMVKGRDLGQFIDEQGALDEQTAWGLARQAAAGLAYAADAGIIHRDIKPANLLMIDPQGGYAGGSNIPTVKITDFGLAFLTTESDSRTRLTAEHSFLGSPHYAAPDQFSGKDVDHRIDIYSLGATVFHMLAGEPPFRGDNITQVIGMKLQQDRGSIAEDLKNVSAESRELVAQMMAPDVADRIADYRTLIDRIDRLIPGSSSMAGEPRSASGDTLTTEFPRRDRRTLTRKRTLIGIIGLAIALAAYGGWWILIGREAGVTLADRPPMETGTWSAELFDGQSISGWAISGGPWKSAEDDEGSSILSGENGFITKTFRREDDKPLEYYCVDTTARLNQAEAIEVHFGFSSASSNREPLALRITRDEAAIGRSSTRGEFSRRGPSRPLDSTKKLHHAVTLERRSDYWWVILDSELLGRAKLRRNHLPRIRIKVEGEDGPAWFGDMYVKELVSKPRQS